MLVNGTIVYIWLNCSHFFCLSKLMLTIRLRQNLCDHNIKCNKIMNFGIYIKFVYIKNN